MTCPRCGEDCHCEAEARLATANSSDHPRFLPDDACSSLPCVGPEAANLSGALQAESGAAASRFVLTALTDESVATAEPSESDWECGSANAADLPPLEPAMPGESKSDPDAEIEDPDAWRRELTERLNRYRSRRRTKGPRYPSLRLKFEASDSPWNANVMGDAPEQSAVRGNLAAGPAYSSRQSVAIDPVSSEAEAPAEAVPRILEDIDEPDTEVAGKIIEFPRSYGALSRDGELAEPVIDRPRILEAPEIVPPPPVLGGITMAPSEIPVPERRPGFDLPLQSAPLGRRVFAVSIDAIVVGCAVAAFGWMADRLTGIALTLPRLIAAGIGLSAFFWAVYQYLLIVHNGSTPGLRAARLQVRCFDGNPVRRGLRRWRVIASIMSGLSLGMGYAWAFLDEDTLCWHDRITHTYLEPKPRKTKDSSST